MSITGAVAELNKEIERLTKIRDSLLQYAPAGTSARMASSGPAKGSASAKTAPSVGKKRVLSAAARKKISEANKARWAKIRGAKAAKTAPPVTKKRVLSAAARKKISEANKARWARIKGAKAAK